MLAIRKSARSGRCSQPLSSTAVNGDRSMRTNEARPDQSAAVGHTEQDRTPRAEIWCPTRVYAPRSQAVTQTISELPG